MKPLLCTHSELSPVQTVLLCTIPLLPASQREAETQVLLVIEFSPLAF